MAANTMKIRIQFRRDTAANWLLYRDVVPAAGEPCFEIDTGVFKIGDGVTTYENLKDIGGACLSADGKSIVIENGALKLAGFDLAAVGAQPRKNANGEIEWVVPSTDTVDGLQTTVAGLQKDVTTLQGNMKSIQDILGSSEEGTGTLLDRIAAVENKVGEESVDKKIETAFDAFMAKVSDDGTVNTVKELIDYVATHAPEATNMAKDITTLQGIVGKGTVDGRILDAITKSEAKATALFERVKYEISHKPIGTLVDYREKEIRVMCPADTQFELQNSGENADKSAYYIGFKAYAPDGAVSFKEDLNGTGTITDTEMYYFVDNDFAGTDAYGRNYSIVWLPVAKHNDDNTWTYYGAGSSAARFAGWYYSVEWYDTNGQLIDTDTIRINLTNENCHTAVEPFYMGSVVKGVKVNGTLLEMVEGKVDIKTTDIIKVSDELTLDADGKLGIGQINVSKLVQDVETEFVLDGGDAGAQG